MGGFYLKIFFFFFFFVFLHFSSNASVIHQLNRIEKNVLFLYTKIKSERHFFSHIVHIVKKFLFYASVISIVIIISYHTLNKQNFYQNPKVIFSRIANQFLSFPRCKKKKKKSVIQLLKTKQFLQIKNHEITFSFNLGSRHLRCCCWICILQYRSVTLTSLAEPEQHSKTTQKRLGGFLLFSRRR